MMRIADNVAALQARYDSHSPITFCSHGFEIHRVCSLSSFGESGSSQSFGTAERAMFVVDAH